MGSGVNRGKIITDDERVETGKNHAFDFHKRKRT